MLCVLLLRESSGVIFKGPLLSGEAFLSPGSFFSGFNRKVKDRPVILEGYSPLIYPGFQTSSRSAAARSIRASRIAFAASLVNSVAPNEKKPLAWAEIQGIRGQEGRYIRNSAVLMLANFWLIHCVCDLEKMIKCKRLRHPPDSLCSWFVSICASACQLLNLGFSLSFGVLLPELMGEFREGRAKTGKAKYLLDPGANIGGSGGSGGSVELPESKKKERYTMKMVEATAETCLQNSGVSCFS